MKICENFTELEVILRKMSGKCQEIFKYYKIKIWQILGKTD